MSVIAQESAALRTASAPAPGAARTSPLFEADNISIAFGGIRAVDGVSFDVKEGEIFAIVGPNGAGKSTIFNLISRIYEPTGGRLMFAGEDITRVAPHTIAGRGIARTFQNIELFEHATVLENLLIGRHCRSRPNTLAEMLFTPAVKREELRHRDAVEEIIDFLNLANYRDQRISGLPYGVRKVVELARALCAEPKLLLLDEPASGLNTEETGGGGLLDRGHQERPRRHCDHDRARHVARLRRLRPRAGAQQRAHPGAR
jgi:branched-chain amino acid transport system ATP-binding protein